MNKITNKSCSRCNSYQIHIQYTHFKTWQEYSSPPLPDKDEEHDIVGLGPPEIQDGMQPNLRHEHIE